MNWVRILLIAIGLAFATGGTAYYVYARARIASAHDWPSVQGQVTARAVDSESRRSGSGAGRRRRIHYEARISYSYTVGGRLYNNDRIWLTAETEFSTREAAERFLIPYAEGAPVAVFYNPANPADAALIVSSRLWPILILAGVGLVLIALGFLLPMRR